MTTTPSMISTPALVLTLGTGLIPAVADVQRIFFQSDARRRATTRFLSLNLRAKRPEFMEVEAAGRRKRPAAIPCSEIIEIAWKNAVPIQNGLASVLHDLRSHEKLIEVGLGSKPHLPLDVMILADLAESDSASLAALLPSIYSLLTNEPFAKVHLLLSIATFSESAQENANVYETLKSICAILEDKEQPCLPQVYLFDRYKEGVWEVHDTHELHIILGNFVLALLSGGLAQRLAHQIPQLDVVEHKAFFCGASATALFFDVIQLQKACAMRLGAEILEMEFHSNNIPNPIPVEEMAADFSLKYANPRTWTNRLCRDSLFHSQAETNVELHFSDLRFEDVQIEHWVQTLQKYDTYFKENILPLQIELITKNTSELNDEFCEQLVGFIQTLPQQPRLYPGGITSARLILERIQKNVQEMRFTADDVSGVESVCNDQIKHSLENLEKSMQSLPKPPVWVLRLPGFLKNPAIQLFNLLFLYKELTILTDLRQESVRLMEQKYELFIKETIHQKLNELTAMWGGEFEKQQRALKRLQVALDRLQTKFSKQTLELISSPSLFRLSALDESVFAWAYYYGNRPSEGFRRSLLGEHGFLTEWHKSNGRVFQEKLENFCGEVYQPLVDTDLEEALHHRNGTDAGFLALSMIQGAVPLLRPNFDQTGSGSSFQLRFLQCRDAPALPLFPSFKNNEQEWEFISTDDRLLATCCCVRMMIPNTALAHVLARGTSDGGLL